MIIIKNKGKNNPIYIPRNNIKATEGSNVIYVTDVQLEAELLKKQDTLVSGESIKTINNESLLGEGNIDVVVDLSDYATKEEVEKKQDQLVSTQNIKTINGNDILGEGNIEVKAGGIANIIYLTQEEYDGIVPEQDVLYVITDAESTIPDTSIFATQNYVDEKIGDIETVLDGIIGK